jgi:hypothetical protein
MRYVTGMESHHCETAAGGATSAQVGALITELALLIDQRPQDALTIDLACRDLDTMLDCCNDTALAADGRDFIAQVTTLVCAEAGVRTSADAEASAARRMPLAS